MFLLRRYSERAAASVRLPVDMTRPDRSLRGMWGVTGAAGLLLTGAMALADGKAYVFVGNEDNASEVAGNKKAADSAQANYEGNGYTVCRDETVTMQDIVNAVNDPNARAIWFVGHGGKIPNNGYTPYWAYNTKANAADRGVRPADLGAGPFNQIQQVVVQGCGQFLAGWRDIFPNASYTSWTGAVNIWQIRFDEFWRGKGRVPPKDEVPAGGDDDIELAVDRRLDAVMPFVFFPDIELELNTPHNDHMAMGLCMHPCLAAEFGSQRFNVLVTDGFLVQLLGGLEVSGGKVVAQAEDGFKAPDFNCVYEPLAYGEAIVNIDSMPGNFDAGMIMITDNTSEVPEDVLFLGASTVMWSLGAVNESCVWDLDHNGSVGATDLLSLLVRWGLCKGCPADFDCNGSVGATDLLALLVNWGPCP